MSVVNSVRPQDHWPDFLKLSLGVGTANEFPISRALNEIVEHISLVAGASILPQSPTIFSPCNTKSVLEGMGFRCDGLSDDEIWELYHIKEKLFRSWGLPDSLRSLSQIYLGSANLVRGRVFSGDYLGRAKVKEIRLSEFGDRENTLVFVLKKTVSKDRIHSFIQSAKLLCPPSYRIFVKEKLPLRCSPFIQLKQIEKTLKCSPWRIG